MHSRRRAVLGSVSVLPNMISWSCLLCPTCVARLPAFWNRWIVVHWRGSWPSMTAIMASAKGENAWTCERHLKTLLFAQWAGLKSLRESVAGLAAPGSSFYHLNLRAALPLDRGGRRCAASGGGVRRDRHGAGAGCGGGAARRERGLDPAAGIHLAACELLRRWVPAFGW